MNKEYVVNRIKKIIERIDEDGNVSLDKTDIEALITSTVFMSETSVDSSLRDWINEIIAQYHDGDISPKMMAIMISYAINAERMWEV